MEFVYTSAEAADLLGVTKSTVQRWYKNGYIGGYKIGDREILRFNNSCFVDWLKTDAKSRRNFLNHTPKSEYLRSQKSLIIKQL